MFSPTPHQGEPRLPRRKALATAVGLLLAVGFVAWMGWTEAARARQDDSKKSEIKKERPDKDDGKKTEADKELEELIEEMTKQMPPGIDPERAKEMREQMRRRVANLTAEQRKQMLTQLRRRSPQPGNGGFPVQPGGFPTPPGLGGPRADGRLGARLEAASATLAEQLDLPKGQGLVVREVMPDSAASKAGLKAHDVLLEFNGKAVSNRVEELARLMAEIKPDTAVEIVVLRKGKKETIKDVKLPEAKAVPADIPPGGAFPPGGGFPPPGLQPPGGFPPPGGGFAPPGGGAAVITTMTRTRDHFTLRHQEGTLIITLTGTPADGKGKITAIHIQDGARTDKYESVDKVPEAYQDKVKNLIEMSEKGSVRIEIKSPG